MSITAEWRAYIECPGLSAYHRQYAALITIDRASHTIDSMELNEENHFQLISPFKVPLLNIGERPTPLFLAHFVPQVAGL